MRKIWIVTITKPIDLFGTPRNSLMALSVLLVLYYFLVRWQTTNEIYGREGYSTVYSLVALVTVFFMSVVVITGYIKGYADGMKDKHDDSDEIRI
jgi:hypothetical protein